MYMTGTEHLGHSLDQKHPPARLDNVVKEFPVIEDHVKDIERKEHRY